MIVEKACWERGCACYDHRVDEGVKVTLAREWVGLTDEEVVARANEEGLSEAFARGVAWAELKLKEKNT